VARVLVGTSGFVYRHWRGILYPPGLPADRWLGRYAEVFSTVELNNSFYRLPTPTAVERWRDGTPPDFCFSLKGSRYVTHLKRLTDTTRGLDNFLSRAVQLGPKLGPILWQLPPQMKADLDRLGTFLAALPRGLRCAFEFRSADWYTDEVCDLLDRFGAAFCEHDLVDEPTPRITGGFRYLRFHGRRSHQGSYGAARLAPVAHDLASWRHRADAYVYFNNDVGGHAVWDALELARLLDLHPDLREPTLPA
jgi:uncharacterized protein YecE (DUF72 family)